ncbi:MAG: hypothetical protein FJ297_12135 [Planctomycetes bacterium]|nr:hypothetical protein [Planctomycetota bacterium]
MRKQVGFVGRDHAPRRIQSVPVLLVVHKNDVVCVGGTSRGARGGLTGRFPDRRTKAVRVARHVSSPIAAILLGLLVLPFPAGRADESDAWPYLVPGREREMRSLAAFHAMHVPGAFADCTLWDGWLPHATLWTGPDARNRYRDSLSRRRIDPSGYVSMQQHRGMAHSEGWPFPAWQQSTGSGWHFVARDDPWAIQNFRLRPLERADDWTIEGAETVGIDGERGWMLQARGDQVVLTTPAFRCGTIVAPFVRLEWAARGLPPASRARVAWRLEGEPDWPEGRHVECDPPRDDKGARFANVALYGHPAYAGIVTRYRVTIDTTAGAQIDVHSLITAIDSRHPITGPLFTRGCADYFAWTKDQAFLRANIERMRRAMRFTLDAFDVRTSHHVVVRWVGHDGRSGIVRSADGGKTLRPGLGVGNNYWDLLPFGGHDALATIYVHDALARLAELERAVAAHPEWSIGPPDTDMSGDALGALAESIRSRFAREFWNPRTGRFAGWRDLEGTAYDYGFTFVNLESISYGIADDDSARAILDWIDGRRTIPEDTSQGADIYHWRFAPRATTRRNLETYAWVWSGPESIPWGHQVQDGGAVLGFSHFDLMARLRVQGPNDAWRRLREILAWFDEVHAEGGYRAYYAKPARGTLQGGGTPGGLGIDHEFLESALVPQVMLYGFLGFRPTATGYEIHPRLPDRWESLTVRRIHYADQVLDVTARANGEVVVTPR